MNANFAVTLAAVYYVIRTLVGHDVPTNAGFMRPIAVRAPVGSVVNAGFPAAVAGGNVETSQRVVDVVLAALAGALPDRVPAASCGSMNNLAFGGTWRRPGGDGAVRQFSYYETIAGGAGAGPEGPGCSAVHTHMTNTLNTPVEALEADLPVRVTRYAVRVGSGGRGRHRGGDGIVRELEFLAPAQVTVLTERRRSRPPGAAGGAPGASGHNELIRGVARSTLPAKASIAVRSGDRLRVSTPGGGGWGARRSPRR
ncbi:MAG: hydantoinase B/oxoprolinase family protein [Candidatus Binatia bacterium]